MSSFALALGFPRRHSVRRAYALANLGDCLARLDSVGGYLNEQFCAWLFSLDVSGLRSSYRELWLVVLWLRPRRSPRTSGSPTLLSVAMPRTPLETGVLVVEIRLCSQRTESFDPKKSRRYASCERSFGSSGVNIGPPLKRQSLRTMTSWRANPPKTNLQ